MLLADGTRIDADAVVVGIGAVPNAQLATDSGLQVDNGVVVDASLRSSDPHIHAVGNVANAFHRGLDKHIRVEHWANALHQPETAARSMLGERAIYDRVPYFFTDQYDLGMEYAGHAEPGQYDDIVVRGDLSRLRVHRVLAGRRTRPGRHERQHLGRQRHDPEPDPLRQPDRPGRTRRPGSSAGPTHPQLTQRLGQDLNCS